MAKQIIYKHYQRIITQWPVDHLRPNVSFQKSIQNRVDARLKPAVATAADSNTAREQDNHTSTSVPASFDEKAELEQINVLYSFLENRYSKKYPLSDKIMKPASNPSYYDDLLKEIDAAPTRSWWAATWNRWKGLIRFS